MIEATFSNLRRPELGQCRVRFPIPGNEYEETLETLKRCGLGDVLGRDCTVDSISEKVSVLKRLEGTPVNVDELNYLAERLDGMDRRELAKFQAMTVKLGLAEMTDLIDLTLCCDRATVVTDFSDLERVGRQHVLDVDGSCSAEALEQLDGRSEALRLLQSGAGAITPYGVVFDNGMKLERVYDGHRFPPYAAEPFSIEVQVADRDHPEDRALDTTLFLPMPPEALSRRLSRGNCGGLEDARPVGLRTTYQDQTQPMLHTFQEQRVELPGGIAACFHLEVDRLEDVNTLAADLVELDSHSMEDNFYMEMLSAAAMLAEPRDIQQLAKLVENLNSFEFLPEVHTAEEYGRYLANSMSISKLEESIAPYIDYERMGRDRTEQEHGKFCATGYVSYGGDVSLEELLGRASAPEPATGMELGGMV